MERIGDSAEGDEMNIETTIMQAGEWMFSDVTRFAMCIGATVIIGCIKGAFSTILR
jgi:hypothetical protein